MPKLVYSYNQDTGVFAGITSAWEVSPGVYAMAANATEISPPDVDETHQAVWDGEAWSIREIPLQPIPAPPNKEELLELIRQIRNNKLAECDWTQLTDAPLSESEVNSWREYRQVLRDIPQTINMDTIISLDDVVWPTVP